MQFTLVPMRWPHSRRREQAFARAPRLSATWVTALCRLTLSSRQVFRFRSAQIVTCRLIYWRTLASLNIICGCKRWNVQYWRQLRDLVLPSPKDFLNPPLLRVLRVLGCVAEGLSRITPPISLRLISTIPQLQVLSHRIF